MDYREYPPPPALRPYVRCIWTLEAPAPSGSANGEAEEPVLPDGCPELIVHYGDRYRVRNGTVADHEAKPQPYAIVAGTLRTAIDLEPTGATGFISARFEPHGATGLFHDSALEFTDRMVDLESIVPGEGEQLTERIRTAATASERVAHLCRFLERRILARTSARRSTRRRALDPAVAYAIRILDESGGNTPLAKVAETLGTSRRTLERRFAEAVGLSPKGYARIIRLQTAVRTIESDPSISLAEAALAAGYYDQAHFNRDFRAIAGQSPTRYFAATHGIGKSITSL